MGMLNARHIFGIPASASTVFNIVSVISGTVLAFVFEPQENWLHPHFGEKAIFGWCFGVLLGGLAQLGIQLTLSSGRPDCAYTGKLNWRDSGLRTVMILMVPSAIAGSAVQVNVAVNGQFASHIPRRDVVALLFVPVDAIAHRHFPAWPSRRVIAGPPSARASTRWMI